MAYCANCGTQISAEAVMCPTCGHPGPGHQPQQQGIRVDFGPVVQAPYASWGKRAGAYLIDGLIIGVIFVVLLLAGVATSNAGPFVAFGLFALASVFYKPVMEGAKGQTLGKMALNIKVVRAGDAMPIGYGEAFIRWIVGAVIGFIPFGTFVDLLWPLWDEHKQTLHDKVAKTIVVDV